MPVQKQSSFVPENIPAYQVVSAAPETYIGFRPINSYRTGKRKVFLSHSHLPPATISTFSTSIRDRGLILAAATSSSSSSSSPLSLSLSLSVRLTFSFSLSFSVFQTSQMIFGTPNKFTLHLACFKNPSN